MPSPFCVCPIRVFLYMTAQRVPIQLVGPLWTGALVGHAARLQPAVDARLTHLKPPSRFGLAATTSNKIHHPLPQIGGASHARMIAQIHLDHYQ